MTEIRGSGGAPTCDRGELKGRPGFWMTIINIGKNNSFRNTENREKCIKPIRMIIKLKIISNSFLKNKFFI